MPRVLDTIGFLAYLSVLVVFESRVPPSLVIFVEGLVAPFISNVLSNPVLSSPADKLPEMESEMALIPL